MEGTGDFEDAENEKEKLQKAKLAKIEDERQRMAAERASLPIYPYRCVQDYCLVEVLIREYQIRALCTMRQCVLLLVTKLAYKLTV